MRNRVITIIGLFALTAWAGAARAADAGSGPDRDRRWSVYMTWEPGIPMGETEDFIAKESLLGTGIYLGTRIRSTGLHAGLSWHWNPFQDDVREPISLPHFDVSGDQSRRIYASPVLADIRYEWTVEAGPRELRPFVGLGAGGYYVKKKVEIGIGGYDETNWHAGLSPAAGIRVPLEFLYWRIGGIVEVRYHYIFEAGDGTEHSYLAGGIGVYAVLF